MKILNEVTFKELGGGTSEVNLRVRYESSVGGILVPDQKDTYIVRKVSCP